VRRRPSSLPVLLAALGLLLGACGFHLRGTGAVDLPPVTVRGAEGDPFTAALRRALPTPVPGATEPGVVLRLDDVVRERRPISVTDRARVAEYALLAAVEFTLLGADGSLLAQDRLSVEWIFRLDADNLLGASGEEDVLRAEMRRDLVGSLLRRIAAETAAAGAQPGASDDGAEGPGTSAASLGRP
jgi:LPS-assembly lipoprotein